MNRAFLNAPTIEDAFQEYLKSWNLPTVQKSWGGKKPTLQLFKSRYSASHEARQRFLAREANDGSPTSVLDNHRMDKTQDAIEKIGALITQLKAPAFVLDEDDPQPAEPAEEAPVTKTVKPENMDALPTTKLVYFYLHRAIEAGEKFALIPVTRGVASQGRSMMAEGKSYKQTTVALVKASNKK